VLPLQTAHSSLVHLDIFMLIWLKPRYMEAKSWYCCIHHNACVASTGSNRCSL